MQRFFAAVFLALVGCGTSGSAPNAVLVVDEITETQCGENTCLRIVVTNHGASAGSGRYTLSGVGHHYKGNGIRGPTFDVPYLRPEQSKRFVRTVESTMEQQKRLLQWSSSCTPGPEG